MTKVSCCTILVLINCSSTKQEMTTMIIFIECSTSRVRLLCLSDNDAQSAIMSFGVEDDYANETWIMPQRFITVLNQLFREKTVLIWKSRDEMNYFTRAVRRKLHFRLNSNSFLLPPSVCSRLENQSPITPTSLREALIQENLETEEKIKNYT